MADFDHFDETLEVDTPLCSARRLDEVMEECQRFIHQTEGGDATSTYDAEHLNFIGTDIVR